MYQQLPYQQAGYYPYTNQQPLQQYQQRIETPSNVYLKGRPVASFEEARAAQIDLDGSLFVFPDIGNKKIYTKQINLDGTVSLQSYSLTENEKTATPEYVTKEEFNTALAQIQTILNNIKPIEEEKKPKTLNSF